MFSINSFNEGVLPYSKIRLISGTSNPDTSLIF